MKNNTMKKEIKIPCVGYDIKADWYQGTNNSVWLVLPGFTSSKENYREIITQSTVATGASALVIDYSGHGESPFDHVNSLKGRALVITHELDDVCTKVATMPFVKAFNADHWDAKGFEHGFRQSDVSDEQIQEYYKKISEWINR